MAMGLSLGHVGNEALGLVTMVGLITIAASTYMITYSHELYALCEPFLGKFERKQANKESYQDGPTGEDYDVIVFGLGRYGGTIGRRLIAEGRKVLGVDFSPEAVKRWRQDGLPALFGDASDPEFIAGIPLKSAKWIISAIPDPRTGVAHHDNRRTLLQALSELRFGGKVAIATHRMDDRSELKSLGADLILSPYSDAANRAVELLNHTEDDTPEEFEIEEQREI